MPEAAFQSEPEISPWGVVIQREPVLPGVVYLTTNRHGGYHLTPRVNERIPVSVRRAAGYYEEDVEAALCAYFVPFPGANPADVLVVLETQYPEIYAGIMRGEWRVRCPALQRRRLVMSDAESKPEGNPPRGRQGNELMHDDLFTYAQPAQTVPFAWPGRIAFQGQGLL